MDPGVEPVGVPQTTNRDPGLDECLLDGVLRRVVAPQDEACHAVQPLGGFGDEGGERFVVALLGANDEISLHRALPRRFAVPVWHAHRV
jgi:hypothetical protein